MLLYLSPREKTGLSPSGLAVFDTEAVLFVEARDRSGVRDRIVMAACTGVVGRGFVLPGPRSLGRCRNVPGANPKTTVTLDKDTYGVNYMLIITIEWEIFSSVSFPLFYAVWHNMGKFNVGRKNPIFYGHSSQTERK